MRDYCGRYAHELQVDRQTIYRWIRDGHLPAAKVGKRGWRIASAAVVAQLKKPGGEA